MMNEPCFVKQPDEVDNCVGQQLRHQPGQLSDQPQRKIGIVAKGCDSRNIVTHIIENKIKREQLVVIGVPCKGMIDKRKVTAMAGGEILAVTETEDDHQGRDGRRRNPHRQGRGAAAKLQPSASTATR
jgi:formate dehydrogenase subunit beta